MIEYLTERNTLAAMWVKQKYTPTQSYVSQDNRSNWQHEQDAEMADRSYKQQMEDRKMQEGLHNLNGFLTFTDYAGLATGVGRILTKGAGYFGKRLVKKRIKHKMDKIAIGEDYTNRLIRALGVTKNATPSSPVKFNIDNRNFVKYLEETGVDISKFTNRDIVRLRDLRKVSINQNLPIEGRYTLITDIPYGKNNLYDADLYSASKKLPIGTINGEESLGKISIGKVNKLDNTEKRVSEDLYNSIIQYGKQRGHDGLLSGEILESPEITYKVWKNFPNKKLVSKTGSHFFNHGETIKNSNVSNWNIGDGEVYKLTKPSHFVPTKHKDMFDPAIIDPITGKLNPPDWNSSSIYKLLIPSAGFSALNNENE